MEFDKLRDYAGQAVSALVSGWEVKIGLSAVLAAAQLHAELLLLFILLICLDLASKWLALARPLCKCDPPSVWHEIRAIPEAHRRGIISSDEMKTRFAGKIIVYLFIAIASGAGDLILKDLGTHPALMALCIGYLAATELLSIIENLNDAGVSAMADLAGLIKKLKGKS